MKRSIPKLLFPPRFFDLRFRLFCRCTELVLVYSKLVYLKFLDPSCWHCLLMVPFVSMRTRLVTGRIKQVEKSGRASSAFKDFVDFVLCSKQK